MNKKTKERLELLKDDVCLAFKVQNQINENTIKSISLTNEKIDLVQKRIDGLEKILGFRK